MASPKKIAFISHFDLDQKRIDLSSKSEAISRMTSEAYRWSKMEYKNALWDEFSFLAHIMGKGYDFFNIWEMPSYSALHVSSVIKGKCPDAETLIIDYMTEENKNRIMDDIQKFDPSYIFVSTTFYLTLNHLNRVLKEITLFFPTVPIVLGGNFVFKELFLDPKHEFISMFPENVYVVNSRYGEVEITSILDGEIEKNPGEIIIKHLKSPDPGKGPISYNSNWWPLDLEKIGFDRKLAPIRTAVGCSFKCGFCSYPIVGGIFSPKEIDIVIDELKILSQKGVKQVHFLDDTLNFPHDRFLQLLKGMLKNKLVEFQLYSFIRCQFLDEETVKLMKECGWQACLLGIESGSNKILKNMNKGAEALTYFKGIELLNKYDIKTFGSVIIGYPGETFETAKETMNFLNESAMDFCYVQPFYYLHNSPIHLQRKKYNLTGKGLRWKHDTMTSNECLEILRNLFFEVTGPIYANEEFNMWEFIYFQFKGFDLGFYRDYRRMINTIRADNIKKYHNIKKEYNYTFSFEDFLKKYASIR